MLDLEQMGELATFWPRVIARSWMETGFTEKLRAQPHEVLESFGLKLPKSWNVKILQGDENVQVSGPMPSLVLHLPERPEGLSTEQAEQIEERLLKSGVGTPVCW